MVGTGMSAIVLARLIRESTPEGQLPPLSSPWWLEILPDDCVAIPPERDDVKAIEPKPIKTNHRQPPRCKTAGTCASAVRESKA